MRALVLSPEDEAQYAKYLEPMPQSEGQRLDYDTYVRDCDARRAAGCSMFRMTNSGFHAEDHPCAAGAGILLGAV